MQRRCGRCHAISAPRPVAAGPTDRPGERGLGLHTSSAAGDTVSSVNVSRFPSERVVYGQRAAQGGELSPLPECRQLHDAARCHTDADDNTTDVVDAWFEYVNRTTSAPGGFSRIVQQRPSVWHLGYDPTAAAAATDWTGP